ncbi:substrate-binding periplasmic protein [Pseudodesulfovibrio karagichevae]|uniref:Substrate-binding periplasmic protein n=1 Tax=Pseudodesulfovibrio karagichevae TaxID=3239305 RepID=A0ABV4K4P6_9BACT
MPRFSRLPLLLALIPALLAWSAKDAPAFDGLVLSLAPAGPAIQGAAVLEAAYARLGIPVFFRDYPARRGLAEANAGAADGEAVRMGGLTRELPDLIQVEPSIVTVQGVAVTCDPDLVVRSRADLAGLRIGVHPGIRLSEKLVHGLDHVVEGRWEQLFRMLYLDRLDVIIAFDGIERTQAGRSGAERLRVIRPARWRIPLYHYLNRRHADLVPRIQAVLETMRDDGEIERILKACGTP